MNFLFFAFLPALVGVPFALGFVIINSGITIAGLPPTEALTGIADAQQLLWMVLALCIIWVGVFMVLSKNTITSGFSGAIKSAGEGVGKFAASVPLSVPFAAVPRGMSEKLGLPAGEKHSLRDILGGATRWGKSPNLGAGAPAGKAAATDALRNNTNNIRNDLNTTINVNGGLAPQALVDDVGRQFKTHFRNRMGKDFNGTDQQAAEALLEDGRLNDALARPIREAMTAANRARGGGAQP